MLWGSDLKHSNMSQTDAHPSSPFQFDGKPLPSPVLIWTTDPSNPNSCIPTPLTTGEGLKLFYELNDVARSFREMPKFGAQLRWLSYCKIQHPILVNQHNIDPSFTWRIWTTGLPSSLITVLDNRLRAFAIPHDFLQAGDLLAIILEQVCPEPNQPLNQLQRSLSNAGVRSLEHRIGMNLMELPILKDRAPLRDHELKMVFISTKIYIPPDAMYRTKLLLDQDVPEGAIAESVPVRIDLLLHLPERGLPTRILEIPEALPLLHTLLHNL